MIMEFCFEAKAFALSLYYKENITDAYLYTLAATIAAGVFSILAIVFYIKFERIKQISSRIMLYFINYQYHILIYLYHPLVNYFE